MRILALCSMLAIVAQPSLCERRNPGVCSNDPGFECEAGLFCNIPSGQTVGSCVQAQCSTASNTCSSDKPICVGGRCAGCSSNSDCAGLNGGAAPLCSSSGACVACRDNSDCNPTPSTTAVAAPICDSTSHTCRACQLHAECSSGICMKDNTFGNLSSPVPAGSCVPDKRVNVVDASQNSLQTALNNAATAGSQNPFVKVLVSSNNKVTVPSLPSSLPAFYVVGPNPDAAPSTLTTTPVTLSSSSQAALVVSSGAHSILEGLVIISSSLGIDCQAGGVATRVRIIRSLIAANTTSMGTGVGIKAAAGCDLSLDSTWIGKNPPTLGRSLSGNDIAMQLDSTRLEMVNSAVYHNASMSPNAFAGISIGDSASLKPLVRIINSSLIEQTGSDARKVLAVDCTSTMASSTLSIVNSLFVNSSPLTGGTTYIHANCRQANDANLSGVASTDAGIKGATNPLVADASILSSISTGDLHYSSSAPDAATKGGILTFTDSAGAVPIPTVDMEGKARGPNQISIGAFEAAH